MDDQSERKLRLDALIRTSQRKKEAKSPQQQRDICESCATVNGYNIVAVHDSGRSESGKTMARETVERALARIRAGETDGVIVAWLDRLGRAPIEEAMTVFREITAAGGVLVPADSGGKPIEPDDPQGETNLVIQLQIARQYWSQTAKRFKMSRQGAIEDGKALSCPFGYRYTDPTPRAGGRGIVDSHLLPDEQTSWIIPELFERKAAEATWLELARWMDTVAPKPARSRWARQSVGAIIRSRTYLGEVKSGEFKKAGAHIPLVSASLWRRAQNQPGRRTPRGTYLLSGLVRCSGCGRHMRASSGGVKKPAVFVCVTPECPLRYTTVVVERLDAAVVEQFFARLEDFHVCATDDAEIQAASEDAKRLTGEVERLAMIVPTHPAAVAAHQRALEEAEATLADVEDGHAQLVASRAQHGPDSRELKADWPTLTLDERREILRAGIDAVLVRRASGQGPASRIPDRVLVLFRGDAPTGLANGRRPVTNWAWTEGAGSLRAAA